MAETDYSVIVECAALAPSVHNTQPWSLEQGGDGIEVVADHSRQLGFLDPTGRQLHLSCGAAIEFAYLTARALGRECTVELLPEPGRPDLLARLRVGGDLPGTELEVSLADAIPRRYTDRGPYTEDPLPTQLLVDVQARAAELEVWVRVLEHRDERTAVATILAKAETEEASDPLYARELEQWTSTQAGATGLPMSAVPSWPDDRVSDVPLRDFSGHDVHPRPGGADVPPSVERDTLVLLGTATDDHGSWLSAGRALGWLLLRAVVDGVSAQPLGPAIDLPDARAALRREFGLVGHAQFLLRLGYGSGEPRTHRLG